MGLQAPKDALNVVDGEHDAPYAQRVHRCLRLSGGRWWRLKLDQLDSTVPIRGPQHGDVISNTV
jgi:hypothetical protein